MSARPEIPAVEGVQDKQVAGILGAMKNIIEMITGRSPIRPQIALLGPNAGLAAMTSKINELIARLQSTDGGAAPAAASGTGILVNVLVSDVGLTNTALYFDGPSLPLMNGGTWLVIGRVTITDTNVGGGNMSLKLWDGVTKVIDSGFTTLGVAGTAGNSTQVITLFGTITDPGGSVRISVKNANNTANTSIKANASGNARDSAVMAYRIS